jgi:hypothetical protein
VVAANPKPTPKPVVRTVRITSVTSPAYPNSYATLTSKTHAGALCSIEVDYASGPSTAAGLADKAASSSGAIGWTWKVGGRTTKGIWPIYITCAWKDQSAGAHSASPERLSISARCGRIAVAPPPQRVASRPLKHTRRWCEIT